MWALLVRTGVEFALPTTPKWGCVCGRLMGAIEFTPGKAAARPLAGLLGLLCCGLADIIAPVGIAPGGAVSIAVVPMGEPTGVNGPGEISKLPPPTGTSGADIAPLDPNAILKELPGVLLTDPPAGLAPEEADGAVPIWSICGCVMFSVCGGAATINDAGALVGTGEGDPIETGGVGAGQPVFTGGV